MSIPTREAPTAHARRLVLVAIEARLEDDLPVITFDPEVDSHDDDDTMHDLTWVMFEVLENADDWTTVSIYAPRPVTDNVNRRALRHIVEAAETAECHFSLADVAGDLADLDDIDLDVAIAAVKAEITRLVGQLCFRLFGRADERTM